MQYCEALVLFLKSELLLSGIVETFRLLILLLFKTKQERFDATQIQ